jgi:hypothetical protein
MPNQRRRSNETPAPDEPFDPEVTEGGVPPQEEPQTLQEFLAETFGEDAPPPAGPPTEGGLPSLGWLKAQFKTKSAAIRYLVSKGHAVGEIAKLMSVKYQHVRNVKTTQLKRGPNEDWNLERRALTEKIETGNGKS